MDPAARPDGSAPACPRVAVAFAPSFASRRQSRVSPLVCRPHRLTVDHPRAWCWLPPHLHPYALAQHAHHPLPPTYDVPDAQRRQTVDRGICVGQGSPLASGAVDGNDRGEDFAPVGRAQVPLFGRGINGSRIFPCTSVRSLGDAFRLLTASCVPACCSACLFPFSCPYSFSPGSPGHFIQPLNPVGQSGLVSLSPLLPVEQCWSACVWVSEDQRQSKDFPLSLNQARRRPYSQRTRSTNSCSFSCGECALFHCSLALGAFRFPATRRSAAPPGLSSVGLPPSGMRCEDTTAVLC